MDRWVCELAKRAPERALLVISGRHVPKWERVWQGWRVRSEVVLLKEMTSEDVQLLVRRYYAGTRGGEPDEQQVDAVVQFARGLPLAATTVVQLWVDYDIHDFKDVHSEVVAAVADRLLEGVPPEMRAVFEVASVPRYFTADTVRDLLGSGERDATKYYDELRRWPFVRSRGDRGLSVHDMMREMINEALCVKSPERFCDLHERAANYYERCIEKAKGDEAELLRLEWLYHKVQADEVEGIKLFQEWAEEVTRFRLVSSLRGLLGDVNRYLGTLKQETSKLWIKYYNARVLHLEAQFTNAETEYKTVVENGQSPAKLRAYAFCDWGEILVTFERLGQVGGAERAVETIEKSLALSPIDSHLIEGYFRLGRTSRFRGQWDAQLDYLTKAAYLAEEQGDKYLMAYAYAEMKRANARRGVFRDFIAAYERGMSILSQIFPEPLVLKVQLLGVWVITWGLMGRFAESEVRAQESLEIAHKLEDEFVTNWILCDLGWILTMQERFTEAEKCFADYMDRAERLGTYGMIDSGSVLGFWGMALNRRGEFKLAERKLMESIQIKKSLSDVPGLPEPIVWLAQAFEVQGIWEDAQHYYEQYKEWEWYGRYYFNAFATTGLTRVKHAQQQYDAIPPLLTEAEQLAQQYEYNDHLSSLRLTQGHIAWDGHVAEWGSGFEAALHYYKQALTYALRYNRFLLDEVLSGRPQGTPLRPIISHCLQRGDEGRKMLQALLEWWQTGANDVGAPRPDTISPIEEGIPLLEAEQKAREREPGDGSTQMWVSERIKQAL